MKRFWDKVDVRGPDECWDWKLSRGSHGYGQVKIEGKQLTTHRLSWELSNGPIPAGMCVLHRCDRRECVNPKHLFLGTKQDNVADMVAKGRQQRGERQGSAKLTTAEVIRMREEHASGGASTNDLASRYGVSHGTVWPILYRRTWRHV